MSLSKQEENPSTLDAEPVEQTESQEETPAALEQIEPSLDVVFDVLRNERRRLVMKSLEDQGGETTLSDLAEHIGGIENDKPPEALNAQERKRVYVGLYQCHLPKMHDAGAIEFDKNRGTVKRGEVADHFHQYLEREVEVGSQWPKYYGVLSVGALVAYAATFFALGSQPIIAIAGLALLGGLALYHWTQSEA